MSQVNFGVSGGVHPTVIRTFPEIGEVHLFGYPTDWKPGSETWQRLASFCSSFYVWEVLAPRPHPTAPVDLIVQRDHLKEVIDFRSAGKTFRIRRGVDAHLLELDPGQAGYFATADCPCFLAKDMDTGQAIFAHAGRECLLNEESILHDGDYWHQSIVDTVMRRFEKSRNIQVRVFCGISGENFGHPVDHPEYGKVNQKRIDYISSLWGVHCWRGELRDGKLCLKTLIHEQFTDPAFGFSLPEENVEVDQVDTYSDKSESGSPMWHSCRRDWNNGSNPCNGVLVVNC